MLPIQRPDDRTECCGYRYMDAIKWNPFNRVVQCHNCGEVYVPKSPFRINSDPETECSGCKEIFRESELDEGVCPGCIKKRDLADSMEWT